MRNKVFTGMSALAFLLAASFASPAMAQQSDQVFGRQLMTQEEIQEHRRLMQGAATQQEREQIRAEHHQRMLERAQQRGVTLPDEPPAMGGGQGAGKGSGQGGQGMGKKKGKN
jgi:hypothetical protein